MRRRSRTGSPSVTSWPSRKIRPVVGSISRLTIRIVVVLPHPDGPTSTDTSPRATSRSRECTATVPSAYVLPTPSSRLDGVPAEVVDAAQGMGFSRTGLLWRVELPLALPAILAGVRVATVSTIGLLTIGGFVSYGGFGNLIYQGFQKSIGRAEVVTAAL